MSPHPRRPLRVQFWRRCCAGPLLVALGLLALSAVGLASPTAAASGDTMIVTDRTEPALAVNPRDPLNIVGGTNPGYNETYPTGLPMTYFASQDGGKTWTHGDVPILQPYLVDADPSMAFDSHGTAFYMFVGESSGSECGNPPTAVLLSRSTDGGRHFSMPQIVDAAIGVLHDKPYLAVESEPHGPDHVFAVWSQWTPHGERLWWQRSVDGGWHFSAPALLTATSWFNFGAFPVVGPRGRITVTWASFPLSGTQEQREEIMARTSVDDGVHWGPITSVSHGYFWGLPNKLEPGDLRAFDSPGAAVTRAGTVFVSWVVVRLQHSNGQVRADVVVSASRDGTHWTRAARVNTSPWNDRFMPTVSPLPSGSVGIAFYDRRAGGSNLALYAARVTLTGKRVKAGRNVRVDSGTSPVANVYLVPAGTCLLGGRFIGDYISSATDAVGNFRVVWSSTQRQYHGQTDIWTASLQLEPRVQKRRS